MSDMSEFCTELMHWLDGLGVRRGIPSPWRSRPSPRRASPRWSWARRLPVKRGGRYFVSSGTFLAAVTVGARDVFRIAASHTDWPCHAHQAAAGARFRRLLPPERGALRRRDPEHRLDRPLGLAGVALVRTDDPMRPARRLVAWDEPLAIIPNVAIHLNREVNKGVPTKPNVDMLPLCRTVQDAWEKKGYLVGKLAERLGAAAEDILSFELCAYCHEPAQLVGFEQDLLSSARLDNLTSVHACLRGLLDADGDTINLAVLYDNEEIGSNTRRGADSSTLTVILEKLAGALGLSRAQYLDACVNGMLLSCDAAHAVHPNHPELADVTCGALLGRGVALKRSPRYSSDADTCAVISGLCDAANIPLQTYMNRADLPGGSTVGSMASSLLAMPAADIGVPLLAMHSARELMAAADQDAFVRLCTAFYSAK